MIKIDFTIDTEFGSYSDALYVEEGMSPEAIEQMKQQRVQNWIAIITAPSQGAE